MQEVKGGGLWFEEGPQTHHHLRLNQFVRLLSQRGLQRGDIHLCLRGEEREESSGKHPGLCFWVRQEPQIDRHSCPDHLIDLLQPAQFLCQRRAELRGSRCLIIPIRGTTALAIGVARRQKAEKRQESGFLLHGLLREQLDEKWHRRTRYRIDRAPMPDRA